MSGWENASRIAAAESYAGWASLLEENPKVLWGLIADIVKAVRAGEGERKTGRRPAATVADLDELYQLLFPACFESRPFPQAFARALGERSQRKFAREAGFNQATVSRLISGRSQPTPELIERIAFVLGIQPTYFVEYRALKLGQILTDALISQPGVSAQAVRTLMGARR